MEVGKAATGRATASDAPGRGYQLAVAGVPPKGQAGAASGRGPWRWSDGERNLSRGLPRATPRDGALADEGPADEGPADEALAYEGGTGLPVGGGD